MPIPFRRTLALLSVYGVILAAGSAQAGGAPASRERTAPPAPSRPFCQERVILPRDTKILCGEGIAPGCGPKRYDTDRRGETHIAQRETKGAPIR